VNAGPAKLEAWNFAGTNWMLSIQLGIRAVIKERFNRISPDERRKTGKGRPNASRGTDGLFSVSNPWYRYLILSYSAKAGILIPLYQLAQIIGRSGSKRRFGSGLGGPHWDGSI
jgi:hypothetical protein